jgi:hypothetical protein
MLNQQSKPHTMSNPQPLKTLTTSDESPSAQLTVFHAWLDLPAELKLEVFSYLFTFDDEIGQVKHIQHLSDKIEPIIRTNNRELVILALVTYYKRNTFKALVNFRPTGRFSMDHPPVAYASTIRHLHVYLGKCMLDQTLEDVAISPASGWRYLCTPPQPRKPNRHLANLWKVNENDNSHWQSLFPNLKTLNLSIAVAFDHIWDDGEVLCCGCDVDFGTNEPLLEWLATATIRIKALKTTVTAKRQGVFVPPVDSLRKCTHIEALEEMLAKKVRRE